MEPPIIITQPPLHQWNATSAAYFFAFSKNVLCFMLQYATTQLDDAKSYTLEL